MLGILGGMGPAATADFFSKFVALTPATRDQEHIPVIVSCLPQIPDRSAAIMGKGPSPLPALLAGLQRLTAAGVQAVVIPCNTSHHWYAELQAATALPILHIADAAIAALPAASRQVMIMATRGALASGFFQRKLAETGRSFRLPAEGEQQEAVDKVIGGIKAGDTVGAVGALELLWARFADEGIDAAIMACTEIPLAAQHLPPPRFTAVDTTLELARAAIAYAVRQGWNKPVH